MIKHKKLLVWLRALLTRLFNPSHNYWLATRRVIPLSHKFGFDRGTPIDRFWIESFLETNRRLVRGVCLEVTDDSYTKRFGGDQVARRDVLDIDPKNKKATIYGDLRNLKAVKNDSYDCIILTHVLGMIDDYEAAIRECYRILKPGGSLLLTVSSLSPTRDMDLNFWRFTPASALYVFEKYFGNPIVKSYGNVLTGQCFWVGMAQEELAKEELEYNDDRYSCVVSVIATK